MQDLFKENYQNQKIMHMIIDKYIDDVIHSSFKDNIIAENFILSYNLDQYQILL